MERAASGWIDEKSTTSFPEPRSRHPRRLDHSGRGIEILDDARPAEFPNLGKTYNIEWTQFQGTAPMTQALAAGALDCATQAPLSLRNGVVGGNLKAYIVAQHVFEKPGGFSVYWAVKDDSPIKTIADLKGKTVGISVIGGGTQGPFNDAAEEERRRSREGHQAGRGRFRRFRGRAASGPRRCRQHEPAVRGARRGQGRHAQAVFALEEMPNIVHILEACRADFVDKNPDLVKAYVRDITSGMKKALANREETLKVVSEQLKAPIPVLETYLLKDNDFGRDPGAAPNFEAIQKMLDIYAATGMLPKWTSRSSSTRPSSRRCNRRTSAKRRKLCTPGIAPEKLCA
jgi:hypothetical protein